ncbi:ead/Ea22-like family protein [Pseudomonas sp. XP2]|uniref:ead/Ea22-like family protein n=1 Tax=Pseudomonas TaxID=286 RepID=UPI00048D571E|nr:MULTISPECIES: ead/Ea22-like family protein [Pseudomonas putida group]HEN8706654.1 ead/Ea22-like family protein [Pseudomonas putida]
MDTNKMRDLKAMAEAAGSDEWYAAGDLRYCDDKTGETHGLHHDDSRFIAAASPATVLALFVEIERLERSRHEEEGRSNMSSRAHRVVSEKRDSVEQERDQLKAENEALRKALGEISGQVDGNIRCTVRDVVNGLPDVQDIYGYCDAIDEIIDAAMAKEASHDHE